MDEINIKNAITTKQTVEDKVAFNEEIYGVGEVIDIFLHRIMDIEECASEYIPEAAQRYNDKTDELLYEYENIINTLETVDGKENKVVSEKDLRKTFRKIRRHVESSPVETLEKSLFVSLFSSFDKFIGDLVDVLFRKEPKLYLNINKEIKISEVLEYNSIDELRQSFLDKEIESIRRKSYQEQFKSLENQFKITLTKFKQWPSFIEKSQRRNLFTHCDGVVSKQYIDMCKEVGYKFEAEKNVGEQLEVGTEYLFHSCMIVAQVGIMLGQTLWRKVVSNEIEKADGHLNEKIFDFLHEEEWLNAITIGNFAQNLRNNSTESMERMFLINHAIALNAINKKKEAKNLLDTKDWSATLLDFKLAYAVINFEYDEAQEIMNKIGKVGELVVEIAYHDWPLFREFRESEQFLSGYESVYGYPYLSKVKEIAEANKNEVEFLHEEILVEDYIIEPAFSTIQWVPNTSERSNFLIII
ncbi:hypothetical protein [Psychrobacter glacincola]|uniref:hypothetical protein n=1 Tax=Psychrobacter glacincola TaxID=56810 RepID=UPI003BB4F20E